MHVHRFKIPQIWLRLHNPSRLKIVQHCQCQYSSSFIVDYQLVCTANDHDIILQAELLPTDSKTALEIYNVIQEWVLSNPIITINNSSYQVDSKCPIEVKELGVTSCSTQQQQQADNRLLAVTTSAFVTVVGVLFIVLIILLLCCIRKKKSKSTDMK